MSIMIDLIVNFVVFFIGIIIGGWIMIRDKNYMSQKSIKSKLTKRVDSICLSIRHDFGLMTEMEKHSQRFWAHEWIHAICKELK